MNSYDSHIIPKPDIMEPKNDYSQIVIIDSRDRNKLNYTNPNEYVMHLNSQFYNVIEIELISVYYKYSNYDIDENNNKLYISNISKNHNIDISLGRGNYTPQNLEVYLNKFLLNSKIINNYDYTLSSKYSEILDKFYLLIDNSDIYNISFKGNEKRYPSTLYGNTISNTNIFDYKNNTDGRYLGFSEKDFTNSLNLFSMKITNTNQSENIHTITLTISDTDSYQQLLDTLSAYDSNMKIYFENSNNGSNTSYIVNNTEILGFQIISNLIIDIKIKLNENINNLLIVNPVFYTNIIMGDIMRNNDRDKYVLLDIKEFNRLESSNTNIQDSYVKIPVNQTEHIYFDNTKNHGTVKYFNPVLKKLDRVSVKIKTRNGDILNSNGIDHTLVFAIKSLNSENNLG
jgi:hypothetical protein